MAGTLRAVVNPLGASMGVSIPESNDPALEASKAARVAQDPYELLEENVTYLGWEHETALRTAFYVRGLTWFRDKVMEGKVKLEAVKDFIPTMKEMIQQRPGWVAKQSFNWVEPFGARQFVDVLSPTRRLTPKFQKAAEMVTLCEAIATHVHASDSSRPTTAEVYKHVRIEAAVSYIHGFDEDFLKTLESEKPTLLRELGLATGQKSLDVFREMARGYTVTNKLARWTHQFLLQNFGKRHAVGQLDFRFSVKRNQGPSKEEDVDAKERDLPLQIRSP